jgi:hypothetical protein
MSVSTETNGRDVRRWPIVALLLGLLVAAIVAGNGGGDASSAPRERAVREPVAMPAESARSAAWYCPGPPPSGLLAEASERVLASNLAAEPVDVAMTVLPDQGDDVRRNVAASPRTAVELAPEGREAETSAMIVEPFGSRVIVESTSTGPGVLATAACATQPSAVWHFAAGTTARFAEQWLVLFNPFGDDAVVDLSFFTDNGFEKPDAWQALTVPRRSRVALDVGTQVRRQTSVASTIRARVGRIVAQQTVIFGPDSDRAGVHRSIGAVATAKEWVFPSGRTGAGAQRSIAISNPGDLDGEVDIAVAPTQDIVIEPVTVKVPRRAVANVQVGSCGDRQPPACIPVPDNVGYSAVVRSTLDVDVVAEDLVTYGNDRFEGATGGPGSRAPARTWMFARSRVAEELDAGLDLLTIGGDTATVDVSFVVNGRQLQPRQLQDVELRPGVRRTIALGGREDLQDVDASIIVRADRPIVAERTIVRSDDVTRDLGIAVRD